MRSLLTRIGLPKAIGLYVEEDVITASQIVAAPWGAVETCRREEKVAPGGLAEALKRLTESHGGRGGFRRVPVAVVLPAQRVYFATRPIQITASDASPHVLLREALRSASVSVSDMAVDVIKAQPDKRLVAGIVACDAEYMRGLLKALKDCGIRPVRAEPGPCALLRAAAHRYRAGRNAKVVLRLFLSESEALAVLVVNKLPVVWRYLSLPRGDEASTILSAARSLVMVSRDCGIESPLDMVLLHGRPDLARLLDVDWMQEQMRVPVRWFDGPGLENGQIAFGSALGCWNLEQRAFDLSHSLKPRASFREIFPWREVAAQVVLLLCMALFLLHRYSGLQESYAALQVHNAQNIHTGSVQESQLAQEKQDLEQRIAAVAKFLGTRVIWTSYERELAGCLPANTFLTSFQGTSELESAEQKKSRGKAKKSLVLQGTALISQSGLMPREIDLLLDKLRGHPALKRDFPVVELTALKQGQRLANETPAAFFTVVCLPKTQDKPGTPQGTKSDMGLSEAIYGPQR